MYVHCAYAGAGDSFSGKQSFSGKSKEKKAQAILSFLGPDLAILHR
jgi:hypothetical protein